MQDCWQKIATLERRTDEIAATYVDGVLEVAAPTADATEPEQARRQIPVKTPKAVRAA